MVQRRFNLLCGRKISLAHLRLRCSPPPHTQQSLYPVQLYTQHTVAKTMVPTQPAQRARPASQKYATPSAGFLCETFIQKKRKQK